MSELVIAGPDESLRARFTMPPGETVRLGRAPKDGEGLAVPWDQMISRDHADMTLENGKLTVRRLTSARNPIYFHGETPDKFTLSPGEVFRIGSTLFRLVEGDITADTPSAYEAMVYRKEDLNSYKFQNSEHLLEVLTNLPDAIAETRSDEEFAARLVGILLEAVPRADAAAVVQYDADAIPNAALRNAATPKMIRWDSRQTEISGFRPSRRLIMSALEQGESLLHVWSSDDTDQKYTYSGKFDWAFCVPLRQKGSSGWCLYVSGQLGEKTGLPQLLSGDALKAELRFIELLAQFTGAIRQVRILEHQQAEMRQFFSPNIRETITGMGAETALEPKEIDISVLFCDVRGFSKKAEQAQDDLQGLLVRVNNALGLMARKIFQHNGVIADFQGDAALGFWGWPVTTPDGPMPACRAALGIQELFRQANQTQPDSSGEFRVGIGIAHGRGIAGKIRTDDQAKVGVFGPVVNLGSRLEGLTKQLRAPILLDETTAKYVRQNMSAAEARVRRLGRFRPYGMDSTVMVSELLPPLSQDGSISDQHILDFETAVDAVAEGRWQEALTILDKLPISDRTKDFIVIFIASNDYEPPPDWDGVFTMSGK